MRKRFFLVLVVVFLAASGVAIQRWSPFKVAVDPVTSIYNPLVPNQEEVRKIANSQNTQLLQDVGRKVFCLYIGINTCTFLHSVALMQNVGKS